jgi:predicted RNase H-like nuclease (RuvC/YqgF family)
MERGVTTMSGDEDVKLLHEEMLKNNATQIEKLQTEIYGIPQRIKNLEDKVTELCVSLSEFLRRIEDKYQTNEMCEVCAKNVDKELNDIKYDNEKLHEEVEVLKCDRDKIMLKLLVGGAIIIGQLIVFIFLNHDKLLR